MYMYIYIYIYTCIDVVIFIAVPGERANFTVPQREVSEEVAFE